MGYLFIKCLLFLADIWATNPPVKDSVRSGAPPIWNKSTEPTPLP